MQTITKYFIVFMLAFITQHVNAQQDSVKINNNQVKIEALLKEKEKVESEEKEQLKAEVEAINQRLEKNEITQEEATQLKKEAAEKRALNIENRLAIIDNQIALLARNNSIATKSEFKVLESPPLQKIDKNVEKEYSYGSRTYDDVIFAIGFNNALIDGQDINDSPYKLGGSGFVELGYAWTTRVFKNSGFLYIKYGASIQWNKLNIKDNQYFVRTGDLVELETFPLDLDKAKFRTTNLVFPVHLQFGPGRTKTVTKNNTTIVRYSNFRVGIGGYAGFSIGHMQKLKYEDGGDRVKDKQKGDFNVNEFIYGVSGYIALGDVAVYVKYDLNPIFRNQAVDQNNISVGLRFDVFDTY
jgi:hypothetical protein